MISRKIWDRPEVGFVIAGIVVLFALGSLQVAGFYLVPLIDRWSGRWLARERVLHAEDVLELREDLTDLRSNLYLYQSLKDRNSHRKRIKQRGLENNSAFIAESYREVVGRVEPEVLRAEELPLSVRVSHVDPMELEIVYP